jgi:ubiquinone/menaquinone biosynthesis C-methylase UbiE
MMTCYLLTLWWRKLMKTRMLQLYLISIFTLLASFTQAAERRETEPGCFKSFVQKSQNFCYQVMAKTFWDPMMSGFKPGRAIALDELDIQPTDKVLFVGEGTGLDFEVLPATLNRANLQAFDFSPEMVKQAKLKAPEFNIPEQNIFIGDAQHLPYTDEKFDKIYFPLSLGSIPNPTLALSEAERVLDRRGKIVVMEKLVDDGHQASYMRMLLNFFTKFLFADINRNLTQMMGHETHLKIVHYQSLDGKLTGFLGRLVGPYYRIGTLVRTDEFPELPIVRAVLNQSKKDQ